MFVRQRQRQRMPECRAGVYATPLSAKHVVGDFDCGSPARSGWLVEHAHQAQRAGLSRVYVVRGLDSPDQRVVGYYALAAGSVAPADATPRLMRGARRYHQPVVILTRLGVDRAAQGVGLGRALAVDALRRIAAASEVIGVRALLIHVLDTPNWSLELNDAFIRGAIDQGRRIYLASPTKGNLIQKSGRFAGQPTVYARELQMLREASYTRVGDYMVPR